MTLLPPCIRRNLLTILQILGVFVGAGVGFGLKTVKEKWTVREISYIKFGGEIFLNMLKGLILPLIVSSMIAAVGSLDLSLSKIIGGRGIALYMASTLLAITLGIFLVTTIQPGRFSDKGARENKKTEPSLVEDTLLDLVRTLFPPNIFQATLQRIRTRLERPEGEFEDTKIPLRNYNMKPTYENETNMMGLVVFSIALGIALASLGHSGKLLINVFQSMANATTIITRWVIWISPIGVVFLIAEQILTTDDFGSIVKSLGLYFSTVLAGLFIHGAITLPVMFFVCTRRMPFRFMINMLPAVAMAFGTASSVATLPVTMQCLEESNKVDPRVSRFLLPIGANVNMDGTALYEAVAAIFVAQLFGADLNIGNVIAIAVTATAASIGAAGIPQAGLVTMVLVLNTVGLPAEYISYIVPIDWLLDRFRTAVNVLGDAFACGIVDKQCRKLLESLRDDDDDVDFIPIVSTTTIGNRSKSSKINIGSAHPSGTDVFSKLEENP